MMRVFLVVATLLALSLAGCAGEPAPTEPNNDVGEPSQTNTGNQTSAPPPPAPKDANVTGATGYVVVGLDANRTSIEPGQSITFDVTAASFFDNGTAANKTVAWTIVYTNQTLGQFAEGTGPTSIEHTFADAGAYVLVLNGTNPDFGYATANVTIIVEAAGELAAPKPGEGIETSKSCSMTAGTPFLAGNILGLVRTQTCDLMTTDQLTVLAAVTAPGSCTVNGVIEQAYDAGRTFTATCTGGEIQPTITIRVRTWE